MESVGNYALSVSLSSQIILLSLLIEQEIYKALGLEWNGKDFLLEKTGEAWYSKHIEGTTAHKVG